MFGFLTKKFRRKKAEPVSNRYGWIDARGLFHFRRTGTGERVMDVFEADRRLRKFGDGDSWIEHVKVLQSAAVAEQSGIEKLIEQARKQKRQAFDSLASLARQTFSLPAAGEFDGWTDAEAFALFHDYVYAVQEVQSEFLPLPKLPA